MCVFYVIFPLDNAILEPKHLLILEHTSVNMHVLRFVLLNVKQILSEDIYYTLVFFSLI